MLLENDCDFECEITPDDSGGGGGPGVNDVVDGGVQVVDGGVNVQAT